MPPIKSLVRCPFCESKRIRRVIDGIKKKTVQVKTEKECKHTKDNVRVVAELSIYDLLNIPPINAIFVCDKCSHIFIGNGVENGKSGDGRGPV